MRALPVVAEWFSPQTVIQALIAAGVIAVAWHFLRPRYVFLIRVRRGVITVAQGKVRRQFLDDLTDIVANEHVTHGTISAKSGKQRISLAFSPEFSPGLQQQIRNAWHASS